jgi:cyclopropane fatty-acyl-phospholipid synthase-like methyltransferase
MSRVSSVDTRARTVRAAYNELGPRFGDWMANVVGEPLDRFLGELGARLEDGARILELGCGDGRTTTRLAERFQVTGVDLSEEQLGVARELVPGATFLHADMMELSARAGAYDAVTAFYSFMHVPRDDHPELLARIYRWLRPSGLFLAPLSTIGGPDRTETWLGVEMFFSGWDAETNARLVREAGFELLVGEVISMREPESDYETAFLWVLARKPT